MAAEDARIVYAEIIDLPYRKSTRHKQMPLVERAAQFSSYKALSGFEEMIDEEAQVSGRRAEDAVRYEPVDDVQPDDPDGWGRNYLAL